MAAALAPLILASPAVPVGRHVVVPYHAKVHQAPDGKSSYWVATARPRIGGTTWQVTGGSGEWLQVSPVLPKRRCYASLDSWGMNLRMYVQRKDLALVTNRAQVIRTKKGGELRLSAGLLATAAGKRTYRVHTLDVAVTAQLPPDALGHHAPASAPVELAYPDGFSLLEAKPGFSGKVGKGMRIEHLKNGRQPLLRSQKVGKKVQLSHVEACLAYRLPPSKAKKVKTSKQGLIGIFSSSKVPAVLGAGNGAARERQFEFPLGTPVLFSDGTRAGETVSPTTWFGKPTSKGHLCRPLALDSAHPRDVPLVLCVATKHGKEKKRPAGMGGGGGGTPSKTPPVRQHSTSEVIRAAKAAGPTLSKCLAPAAKGAASNVTARVVNSRVMVIAIRGPHGAPPKVFACLKKAVEDLRIPPGAYEPLDEVSFTVGR